MTTLLNRAPTAAECFQSLAASLERLGGRCNRTAAAIQDEMAADEPNLCRAAAAIDVPVGDLVTVFADEMLRRGFLIARRWTQ